MQAPARAPSRTEALAQAPPHLSAVTLQPDLPGVVALIVGDVNRLRASRGLSALVVDARLAAASQAFADFMAASGRFGHAADGRDPGARALAHGYGFCFISENVAYRGDPAGFSTAALAEALSTAWQNSPPHRENLLAAETTDTGFGIALGDQGRYFAVQLMGQPDVACPRHGTRQQTARAR